MVEAPDPANNGQQTEFTSQYDVEQTCLWENHQCFNQANLSPFLSEPLYSQVGCIGLNDFTKHILEHDTFPPTFDSSQVDPAVHCLLLFLRKTPNHTDQL